jgi:RNA-splicing ligase RtcB
MPRYKNLNGVRVQLTAEEEATRDTEEKIWSDAKSTRQLAEIRRIRNEKLSETDYLAMSDNIMSENMIDFRKQLRDIPQDFSETDYDDLLARDEQGNLTHTVWSKP